MDRDWKDFDWKELKIIRYFFQIQENGNMPEGSKLLLEAMKPVQIEAGQDIVSLGLLRRTECTLFWKVRPMY